MTRITPAALARWRRDPIVFVREALIDPETGQPFERHKVRDGAERYDRQRRTLMALGLERRAKTVTTLGDLWRAEHAAKMAAAATERKAREAAVENQDQPEEQS